MASHHRVIGHHHHAARVQPRADHLPGQLARHRVAVARHRHQAGAGHPGWLLHIAIEGLTPSLLSRVRGEGIAEKELSALLARDLLVPILHDTTYEALRDVSPLLGSRSGLSTTEGSLATVAAKLAELVAV